MNTISLPHFMEAARNGGRVTINHDSPTPYIVKAKEGIIGRSVYFLANIPILKEISFIKAYVKKVNIENREVFALFINVLSKRFGTEGVNNALERVDLSKAIPLNARVIKNLSSIAENVWGRGEAKTLKGHAVIRVWPFKGIEHPGHTSITVKNCIDQDPANHRKEYISLWPKYGEEKNGVKSYFGSMQGHFVKSYQEDKISELSLKTAENLALGAQAREILDLIKLPKLGEENIKYLHALGQNVSDLFIYECIRLLKNRENISQKYIDHLKKLANFLPRGTQKELRGGEWGTSSLKVYLPLIGKNKYGPSGTDKFMLFGLDESAFLKEAEYAKAGGEAGKVSYTFASKTENCASMTARMLIAGGTERFVPFSSAWISEDPNTVHKYAQAVQEAIDQLNQKANKVINYCKDLPSLDSSAMSVMNAHQARNEVILNLIQTLQFSRPSAQDDIAVLTDKAKNLVQAMDKAIENSSQLLSNEVNRTLLQAYHILQLLQSRMGELTAVEPKYTLESIGLNKLV